MNYKQTMFAIVVFLSLIMVSLFYYGGGASLLAGKVTAMVGVNVMGVVMSNGIPVNDSILTAGTTSTVLGLDTGILANCSYSAVAGTPYNLMTPFTNTNARSHSSTISVVGGTTYNYYIKCKNDATGITPDTYHLNFSVAQSQQTIYASGSTGDSAFFIQYNSLIFNTNLGESMSVSIKGETHKFIGNEIGRDYVVLTFYSEPVTVTVFINKTEAVDLDADTIDDLEISLLSIRNRKATVVFTELKPAEKTALEKFAAIILSPLKRMGQYISEEYLLILAIAAGILVICTVLLAIRYYHLRKSK